MEKNSNIIYGVDVTKDVTPIMVRDAMIQCFYKAHCNVLELARETFGHPPENKFEEMKKSHVKELVEDIYHRIGGDFNNPTKENLIMVLEKLKEFASIYRRPNIVKKHVAEILILINKLD
ncbi:MAG: hypothetical protein JSU91_07160 [Thermoplasmatales archaeon]|nr:MAG: hypothetical protein JSU91_07160 [Thermoplasmatales archaeon]